MYNLIGCFVFIFKLWNKNWISFLFTGLIFHYLLDCFIKRLCISVLIIWQEMFFRLWNFNWEVAVNISWLLQIIKNSNGFYLKDENVLKKSSIILFYFTIIPMKTDCLSTPNNIVVIIIIVFPRFAIRSPGDISFYFHHEYQT